MLYNNYYESVANDVENYIESNEIDIEVVDYDTLLDEMMLADDVTGNGSGSYFFSSYKAMECVTENIDEVRDALEEYCYSYEQVGEMFLDGAWEKMDVITRCYYLPWALSNYYEERGIGCC